MSTIGRLHKGWESLRSGTAGRLLGWKDQKGIVGRNGKRVFETQWERWQRQERQLWQRPEGQRVLLRCSCVQLCVHACVHVCVCVGGRGRGG